MSRRLPAALAAALVLAACGGENGEPQEGTSLPPTVASPASTSPPPPEPDGFEPASGDPSDTCLNGWSRPERDDRVVGEGLRIIRRHMDVKGGFSLQDFRYFEGPESPPSDKGYLMTVRRWYYKGHLRSDPGFRARWLVEEREFGSGIVAVAPYDSQGFRSPHWVGFEYRERLEPRSFEGIPGEWRAEPYDFVRGADEPDIRVDGLPPEVRGCMAGT